MRCISNKLLAVCLVWFTFAQAQAQVGGSQGRMEISDATLTHVWTQAHLGIMAEDAYGVRLLTEPYSTLEPDPTPTLRAHYYLDRSTGFPRSILGHAFYPGEGELAYSLHWPVLLRQYHLFRGDDDYVRALVESALPVVMEHFAGLDWDDAATNLFYYRALKATAGLHRDLGLPADVWEAKARVLKVAIVERFWDSELSLFVDEVGSDEASVAVNALAVCFGVTEDEFVADAVGLIRKAGADCPDWYVPYVVEACFVAGEQQLGIDLLSFVEDFSRDPSPLYLIPQYVFGVAPGETGWDTIAVSPRLPKSATSATLEVPVPQGRVGFAFHQKTGVSVRVPVSGRVLLDGPEGLPMVVKQYRSHSMPEELSTEARAELDAKNWTAFAGEDAFIWVSIDEQMLRIVRGDVVEYEARCASAEKGIGSVMDSLKTPLGWHTISKKIGGDAPWGQVFRSRRATREVWQPGEDTKEDLVLSRVLLLDGEEPGLNKGGRVDSLARNIYIHGTNDEARIGVPSSHGCIRMLNDDVIEMYGMIDRGMKVLITGTE